MKVAEVIIKDMFKTYGAAIQTDERIFGTFKDQYVCGKCYQGFAANWAIRANPYNSWIPRGSHMYCPHCGQSTHRDEVGFINKGSFVPWSMTIRVHTYTTHVSLSVTYEGMGLDKDLFQRSWCKGSEFFRFDAVTRKVSFKSTIITGEKLEEKVCESFDFCNPFETKLFETSILRYLRSNCLGYATHKDKLVSLIKALQNGLRQVIINKTGFKNIPSFYSNHLGSDWGVILPVVQNLAFRLAAPEFSSLPAVFKRNSRHETFSKYMVIDVSDAWFEKISKSAEKTDFTTAIIEHAGIPNKPFIRKEIMKNFLSFGRIKYALNTVKKYNLAIKLYETIKKLDKRPLDSTSEFFKAIAPIYGEKQALSIFENEISWEVRACYIMYKQLTAESLQAFSTEKPALRHTFEWLSGRIESQKGVFLQYIRNEFGYEYMAKAVSHYFRAKIKSCVNLFGEISKKGRKEFISAKIPVIGEWYYWLAKRYYQEQGAEFWSTLEAMYDANALNWLLDNHKDNKVALSDCIRLYNYLTTENQKLFFEKKPSISIVHDWLAEQGRRQKHEAISLNIPDHIRQRLTMQIDRLKFFLPEKSIELLELGNELKNCVLGYSPDVVAGRRAIVIMTDDRGKAIACLEVAKGELVQAKLYDNDPVYFDAKINKAIIDWAEKSNLAIKTRDVVIPTSNDLPEVKYA